MRRDYGEDSEPAEHAFAIARVEKDDGPKDVEQDKSQRQQSRSHEEVGVIASDAHGPGADRVR